MSIDPRLAERRAEVAEDRAKRNVWRLLRFFLLVAIAAGVVWFALSPWMSVSQVRSVGVRMSDTEQILAEHRFVPGTPMILLRTGPAIDAIRTDPWVRDVDITLNWPTDVVVRVEERVPRAWVETGSGWTRRSEDGFPLPSAAAPDGSLGRVLLPHIADSAATESEAVLGAIEFLMSLPEDIATETTVRLENDELWAVVNGFEVRLGRGVEMREKAVSLMALLTRGLAEGTVIILVAPTHPSTVDPVIDGVVDAGNEDDAGEEDAGDDGAGDDG